MQKQNPSTWTICTSQDVYDVLCTMFEQDKYSLRLNKDKVKFIAADEQDPHLCWISITIEDVSDIQTLFHAGVSTGYEIAAEKYRDILKVYSNQSSKINSNDNI